MIISQQIHGVVSCKAGLVRHWPGNAGYGPYVSGRIEITTREGTIVEIDVYADTVDQLGIVGETNCEVTNGREKKSEAEVSDPQGDGRSAIGDSPGLAGCWADRPRVRRADYVGER